jgi:hypothetical protein
MANVTIPAYTAEELTARIEDGSIDHIRLAATVAQIQKSVAALAEWANSQIVAANQGSMQNAGDGVGIEAQGRKRK